MTPAQRRMVRTETVVSTAISALIPTAIIWYAGVAPPAALAGADGLVSVLIKGIGIPALMISLAVTLLVRSRRRKGSIAGLARTALVWPPRLLPGNLVVRAVIVAVVALAVLVPTWLAVVVLLYVLPLTSFGLLLLNLALGVSIGVAVTPWVVMRALADTPGLSPAPPLGTR